LRTSRGTRGNAGLPDPAITPFRYNKNRRHGPTPTEWYNPPVLPTRAILLSFRARPRLSAAGSMLLIMLAVRLWWGWHMGRKVESMLADLRRRGEPVTVEDLIRPPVPDEENGYLLLKQAAQIVRASGVNSPSNSTLDYPDYPPFSDKWMTMAEASETANAQAFVLLRQARKMGKAQVDCIIASPLVNHIFLPYLNDFKALVNATADGTILSHIHGNDGEALVRAADVLHVAKPIRDDPFIVSIVAAMGIEGRACVDIQVIAPALRADNLPATRQSIEWLIRDLLEESGFPNHLNRAFAQERMFETELAEQGSQGFYLMGPLADYSILRTAENAAAWRRSTVAGHWIASAKPAHNMVGFIGYRYRGFFSDYTEIDLSYLIARFYRHLAERRVTALDLACQLYRMDTGHFPVKLDDVVPRYLPAIPIDPFRSDGGPIGYTIFKGGRPDGGDRPLLTYEDGPNDLGPPQDHPAYGWQNADTLKFIYRGQEIRQYRDLTRFAPLQETIDNGPKEAKKAGDED
jgi:hypothetical protein